MGEGKLLAAAAALIAGVVPFPCSLPAQGPVYREHWQYLHLEQRRLEVLAALRGRDEATTAQVAQALAAPGNGVDFGPVAAALALLRGVKADDDFVLRTSIGAFVLPEVVDPEAAKEVCRALNVSIFLAPGPNPAGALEFDVVVRDAEGATRWSHHVDRDTKVADLRMARAVASMPTADLPDGVYTASVATLVDGVQPRATDPTLSWPFRVLRGYQARSEEALRAAAEALARLQGRERALFEGLWRAVGRAYTGEPFVPGGDALRDLERLECALHNVAAGAPVLDGITGDITTLLPGPAGAGLQCVLRVRDWSKARPLVVFDSATPATDLFAPRPTAPVTRAPAWTACELSEFAATRDWNVACLESPGAGQDHFTLLTAGLQTLREMLPAGAPKPVLVCDREAAAVVAARADRLREHLGALVLVGAGVMPAGTLPKLGDLPVRYLRLSGYPASAGIDRLLAFAAERRGAGEPAGDLGLLTERAPAWSFGLPLAQREIEDFAAAAFARR